MRVLDVRLPPGASSLLASLRALLRAAGDARDAAEVDVLSGFAFRLIVSPELALSGPTAFPWDHELRAALSRLGYDVEVHYAEPGDPRYELLRERALAAARRAIEQGRPALAWGVQVPAFGIVRGFDDARGRLLVSGMLDGAGAPADMPYERLGHGDVPVLCVAALGPATPVDAEEALLAALGAGLGHLHGTSPVRGGFASGLAAYQAIDAALASFRFEPSGLAYTVQLLAEARTHVAEHLAARTGDRPGGSEHGAELAAAADAYRRLAAAAAQVAARLPFPAPFDAPLTGPVRDALRAELRGVAKAEAAAAAALDRLVFARTLARRQSGLRMASLTPAESPALFSCIQELPVPGLDAPAGACRQRVGPQLGDTFRARVLWDDRAPGGPRVAGHVYSAPLGESGYPVTVAGGRHLYLYCCWLRRDLRGLGIGRALLEAVAADARAEGWDGIVTLATSEEIFLHHAHYARLGYVEVDREGNDRLLYLPLRMAQEESAPRYAPVTAVAARDGAVGVRVRHGYNCPLLFATRQNAAAAARARGGEAALDEADAAESGDGERSVQVTIGGQRLPLGYIPESALLRLLAETR